MKRVLILGRQAATFKQLSQRLTGNGVSVEVAEYQDLAFLIDGEKTSIRCYSTGQEIKNYQEILVLSTSPYHRENYIFSALACYCRKHHIRLLDDNFTNTDGKLYAMWRFWEQALPTPRTAFGPAPFLIDFLAELGGEGVLKSVNGTKGKDNYLVHSPSEIQDILSQNPDIRYTLQNFIPNDGDYRIIVTNFEPQLAIYRSSGGKDFRNNTSLGGEAKIIPLTEVSSKVIQLAVNAAKALNIKIAGADILEDKTTGEFSVLEVNRTPQLATGAFPAEKAEIIRRLIHS